MAIGIIVGIIIAIFTIAAFGVMGHFFSERETVKGVIALVVALVLCITFILVPFSFHTTQDGSVSVVKRLGKIVEVKQPGTNFGLWITDKYQKYDTKVRELTIDTMAYSSDAQQMTLSIKFQYQIMSDKAVEIAREYGSLKALETRMQSVVTEKTKSEMSKSTAMEIISNRASLSPNVEAIVKDNLGKKYYVSVEKVSITNIDFSDAFENAVEEKMIAEQKQLKAKYEAEAKIVTAEATAKANELLERTLTDKILQEMYLKRWDGKLPQVVTNGNAMFQIPSFN
jgi:regulator of protease activity HflC (stomatin/prohibitin superfamily)